MNIQNTSKTIKNCIICLGVRKYQKRTTTRQNITIVLRFRVKKICYESSDMRQAFISHVINLKLLLVKVSGKEYNQL